MALKGFQVVFEGVSLRFGHLRPQVADVDPLRLAYGERLSDPRHRTSRQHRGVERSWPNHDLVSFGNGLEGCRWWLHSVRQQGDQTNGFIPTNCRLPNEFANRKFGSKLRWHGGGRNYSADRANEPACLLDGTFEIPVFGKKSSQDQVAGGVTFKNVLPIANFESVRQRRVITCKSADALSKIPQRRYPKHVA